MNVDEQVQEALLHASRTKPNKCLLVGRNTGEGCFLDTLPEEDNEALQKCLNDKLLEVGPDEDDRESTNTVKLTTQGIQFLLEHTDTANWTPLITDAEDSYRGDFLSCAKDRLADHNKRPEQTEVDLARVIEELILPLSEACRRHQSKLDQIKKELDTLYETHRLSTRSDNDSLKEEDAPSPNPKTDHDFTFMKSVLMELIIIWRDNSEGSETRTAIERALTNLGATKCHFRDDLAPFDPKTHHLLDIDGLTSLPKDVQIAEPGWSFKREDRSMTLLKAQAIPINTDLDGTNDTIDHQSTSTDDTSSNDLPMPQAAASLEVSNSSTQTPDNDTETQTQTPNAETITQTDADRSTKPPPTVNEDDSSD